MESVFSHFLNWAPQRFKVRALLLSIVVLCLFAWVESYGATRPYVYFEEQRQTFLGVTEDGRVELEDGRLVEVTKEAPVGYENLESYKGSPVCFEASIAQLKAAAIDKSCAQITGVTYSFEASFSQDCAAYGILTLHSTGIRQVHIPFAVDEEGRGESGGYHIKVRPFDGDEWEGEYPTDWLYEVRLFERGREIGVASGEVNPLQFDEARLEATGDAKPAIYMAYVVSPPKPRKGFTRVVVEFVLDEECDLLWSKVISRTGRGFDTAAKRSIAGTRFYPAVLDGKRVPVKLRLPIDYSYEKTE